MQAILPLTVKAAALVWKASVGQLEEIGDSQPSQPFLQEAFDYTLSSF